MSDLIIAIDPGNIESAYVVWDGQRVHAKDKVSNDEALALLSLYTNWTGVPVTVVIEMIACYGKPVGKEVFDTCVWVGRFLEHWRLCSKQPYELVYRTTVKRYICKMTRAKDSDVRKAIIDRFGAPGTKANPNPITYGMRKDIWQAFALAVYWYDNFCREAKEAV